MALLRFLPNATHIDFVRARYVAFAIDGLLLLVTIVSIAYQGFNLGIDFTGGVEMEVKSVHTIDIGAMRAKVDTLHFGESALQYIGGGQCEKPVNSCMLIRIQPRHGQNGSTVAPAIQKELGAGYSIRSNSVVGPAVSEELFHAGVMATVLAIIAIALWVAFRFEWQYGISAAIATGHDVLVTAGLFSVFHLEFGLSSIAALLTLAGYSINDTVVIFDRIREDRRKYKRMSLADLINLSTNQMLTRTILTSVLTAISIIPLLLFGGPALFDFSAPILFGIVVGTFSSVYIAAALMLYLPAPAGVIEGAPSATAKTQ